MNKTRVEPCEGAVLPGGMAAGEVGPDLKPCPFCGGDSADYMPDRLMAPGADPPVFCNECHASAMDAAAWNRRADDWQPIETAPRDQLLLLWDRNAPVVAYYHRAAWRVGPKGHVVYASHWRPLPEGPR